MSGAGFDCVGRRNLLTIHQWIRTDSHSRRITRQATEPTHVEIICSKWKI